MASKGSRGRAAPGAWLPTTLNEAREVFGSVCGVDGVGGWSLATALRSGPLPAQAVPGWPAGWQAGTHLLLAACVLVQGRTPADLLDHAHWVKGEQPVLHKSVERKVWGPGGASVTTTPGQHPVSARSPLNLRKDHLSLGVGRWWGSRALGAAAALPCGQRWGHSVMCGVAVQPALLLPLVGPAQMGAGC